MTEPLVSIMAIALVAAAVFAWQWRVRGKALADLSARCANLEISLEAAKDAIVQLTAHNKDQETAIESHKDSLKRAAVQLEQLRDQIKINVARRREFDEWANPIRASLGEGLGKVMQALKDRLARQEFAVRRQERIVAEAQDQYRGKRDELERLRRELTLKNYHIAALNERFIRIEERMQELIAQSDGEPAAGHRSAPATLVGSDATLRPDRLRSSPSASPETERFTLDTDPAKDWMGVLEDWHRQLEDRFERLEQLQARMRGPAGRSSASGAVEPRRNDSAA